MDKRNFYIFPSTSSKEEALKKYKDRIKEDTRFDDNVDEELLTIEEDFISYYFFEADIYNHNYYYADNLKAEKVDGKLDIHYQMSDPEFMLNGLDKKHAILNNEDEYIKPKYKTSFDTFIEGIKEKATTSIYYRHNAHPSKNVYVDFDLIDGFDNFKVDIYIEKILIFRYHQANTKKDFVSIYSLFKNDFYTLDFISSKDYLDYLKLYKKPIEYVPRAYLDYYHKDSYSTYKDVNKKLEFESYQAILKKVRDNVDYPGYASYGSYLNMGIYYFRNRAYLKKIDININDLNRKIYLAYLSLKYNEESGVFLYECACLGLLDNNSLQNKLKLLGYSYRLKNPKAKRILYEHYKEPRFYNEAMIKKYS